MSCQAKELDSALLGTRQQGPAQVHQAQLMPPIAAYDSAVLQGITQALVPLQNG